MISNNLKLAWRHLWKNRGFTLLNLLGLAVGFAGFILSYQYINRETSYDRWNPNLDNIYLIGLSYQGENTDQTPPSLAPILMQEFPEVEAAGRMMPYPYGSYPIFGKETALVKNAVMVDSAAAAIFRVRYQDDSLVEIPSMADAAIVKTDLARILFSSDSIPSAAAPITLQALSTHQQFYENFYGVAQDRRPSYLDFDMLLVKRIWDEEETGNPFTFQTFVQVANGTNVEALTHKINTLYQSRISKHRVVQSSAFAQGEVYLDPLKNIHLQPKHTSNAPYITIWVLGVLSIVILVLAGINFTNLFIAQADQRAKEIGVKKLYGIRRSRLGVQFLMEVFFQCLAAALIAWGLLVLGSNSLQKWFNDDIGTYMLHSDTLLQLLFAVVLTTCMAGIYPALALSAFKPIHILKGNFQTGHRRLGFRNALMTFQFVIACTFISSIIVINTQLDFMRSEERGFEPAQVINFRGMGMFYSFDQSWKIDLGNRLKESGHITHFASATNTPGGNLPPKLQFIHIDNTMELEYMGVDLDYFDLLSIPTVEGRSSLSDTEFIKDTVNHYAVLNQSAVQHMGVPDPIGAKIRGCETDFTVIGVVADSKFNGFEHQVAPAIYSFNEECSGRYKQDILVKTAPGKTREAIQMVESEWVKNKNANLLPLDYEFLDQQYEKLYAQQQQLQHASTAFVVITLLIAAIGLFGMSAFNIAIRKKEMGIRKVLGASIRQLFMQLNKPFLRIFVLANIIAIPISYLLINQWLDNFAYKAPISLWVYLLSGLILLLIVILTVLYQSIKAARENPVESLRDE